MIGNSNLPLLISFSERLLICLFDFLFLSFLSFGPFGLSYFLIFSPTLPRYPHPFRTFYLLSFLTYFFLPLSFSFLFFLALRQKRQRRFAYFLRKFKLPTSRWRMQSGRVKVGGLVAIVCPVSRIIRFIYDMIG